MNVGLVTLGCNKRVSKSILGCGSSYSITKNMENVKHLLLQDA